MHYIMNRDGKVVLTEQGVKGVDLVKAELKKQLSIKTVESN